MEVTLLANILTPIARVLGLIMNGLYAFLSLISIENLAVAIILFTLIMKVLMLPLTIKQQKFTRMSSRMNPEIQKIQAKYKGKRDEASIRKLQAETQAVYQKYGVSGPMSGCLPMLIMLPIMFALYQVINNIPNYVTAIRDQYQIVSDAVLNNPNLASNVAASAKVEVDTLNNSDAIIKVLAHLKSIHWDELIALIKNVPGEAYNAASYIVKANGFFNFSISDVPTLTSMSVLIPILSMALQFVQSKQLSVKTDNSNPTANAMSSMNYIMPIMSGFFALVLPIGVGIYWISNSAFSIIQQFFVNKYMDNVGLDELVEKSVEKSSKKYVNNKANSSGSSLQELARKQTRTIETNVSEKSTDSEVKDTDKAETEAYRPSSISEIANLLKNRNEKGDK